MLTHRANPLRCPSRSLLTALLAVVLVTTSCQKMPLVAPSGTAIALIPTTNVLPVNGSTDIVAMLVEGAQGTSNDTDGATVITGGTPVHNGTLVTFTTTLGRLEPAEARTTAGRATVRLVADGRSGLALVTAFSGSAAQSIEIAIGAAGAERIAMTADPQSLPGTGGSSTIAARVEEANGNGIAGVQVSFSTTRGSLSQPSSLTNANGVATTVLTTTQEAVVTANTGGTSFDLAASVTVTLKPRAIASITPPSSATVGVPATFTVTPGADATLTDILVNFGDGRSVSLGAISTATTVTHVFRTPGQVVVTATATDGQGEAGSASTQVAVAPLSLSLTATPSFVQTGTLVTFTATPTTGALIDRYIWNFGDGEGDVETGSTAVRAYPTAGPRVVSVRAIPLGNGTAATALVTVQVQH